MGGLPLYQVDAFTDKPYGGNPAAVCMIPAPRDDSWLQKVASEMNLSETAFLCKQEDGFNLRWFTPTVEEDLCGHATLASAHILWETGLLQPEEQARFYTRSGILTAKQKGAWIEMKFPSTPDEPVTGPPDLLAGLGVTPKYVGRSRFDYLLEVDSEETVRNLNPDFTVLKKLSTRGIIATSLATASGFDFVSRFFAPGEGINEDPVTGSAHCCLGPFWSKRLQKDELVAYQASNRGGVVRVRLADESVYLAGQAVTVLRGELIDP